MLIFKLHNYDISCTKEVQRLIFLYILLYAPSLTLQVSNNVLLFNFLCCYTLNLFNEKRWNVSVTRNMMFDCVHMKLTNEHVLVGPIVRNAVLFQFCFGFVIKKFKCSQALVTFVTFDVTTIFKSKFYDQLKHT